MIHIGRKDIGADEVRRLIGVAVGDKKTLDMIYLSVGEGWTHERIAVEYGVERPAVTRRLLRARKKLGDAGIELLNKPSRVGVN